MTPDSSSQPAQPATSPSATPTPDADPTLDPGPVPPGDSADAAGAEAAAGQRFDLVWRDGVITVGQESEPASSLLIADIKLAQSSPLVRITAWRLMPDGSYRAACNVRDEVIRVLAAGHGIAPAPDVMVCSCRGDGPEHPMGTQGCRYSTGQHPVLALQLDDEVRYDRRPARTGDDSACVVCGVLIPTAWAQIHSDWHTRLLRAVVDLDERVQALEGHPRR